MMREIFLCSCGFRSFVSLRVAVGIGTADPEVDVRLSQVLDEYSLSSEEMISFEKDFETFMNLVA
jgi:hypothetical protein